ncbi:hypothetical protein B484DRAFT_176241 [Ochromonadaceae sp. CCMP2298]|nr:hypothetical protein B484DRAFT_176241 [Ochromonadaceae sp. CCMP2298]
MTSPDYWSLFLSNPETFALTVGPFLSNRELFRISVASRTLLNLRYALGRWAVQLDGNSYNAFRAKRHSAPCFATQSQDRDLQDTQDFDLVTVLGNRLKVVVRDPLYCCGITDVAALAGVYSLNLTGCLRVMDVSTLGGVHTLNLSGCYG